MSEQKFIASVRRTGSRYFVVVPFNPDQVWGAKGRHYVAGTVNGVRIRALLASDEKGYYLPLGAAWRRDSGIDLAQPVTVILSAEGPQQAALAADIAAALAAEPAAQEFFDSLATYYRKGYVEWVESARRPQTRAARVLAMAALLKEGRKQREKP